jgi:hypothetical protein
LYSFLDASNDNDAMVAHMGAFEVHQLAGLVTEPAAAAAAAAAVGLHASGSFSTGKQLPPVNKPATAPGAAAAAAAAGLSRIQARLSMDKGRKTATAAADAIRTADVATAADGEPTSSSSTGVQQQQVLLRRRQKRQKEEQQLLHVYSIAAPGMRRSPEGAQELAACAAWSAAVNMKRGWRQKQKGFFEAPGELVMHQLHHHFVRTAAVQVGH